MKNLINKCWSFIKDHLAVILTTIFLVSITIWLDVKSGKIEPLTIVSNLISFLASGYLGSYFIAKNSINKDVEKEIKGLKESLETKEKEKQTFLKNLEWVIKTPNVKSTIETEFKSKVEYEAYKNGHLDAVNELCESLLGRIRYGIIETKDMYIRDWSKEDQSE